MGYYVTHLRIVYRLSPDVCSPHHLAAVHLYHGILEFTELIAHLLTLFVSQAVTNVWQQQSTHNYNGDKRENQIPKLQKTFLVTTNSHY